MPKKNTVASALIKELKEKRLSQRLSMREAAPLLDAQVATLWRWEKGLAIPNQFHTYKIRKWLGYL